jgi:FkbM family methyltransferase
MSYSFGGKLGRHAAQSTSAPGIVWALESVSKAVEAAEAMNKNFGYALINLGRKAFVGTPVQKLRITSVIYNKIFRSMYREGDATAEYKGVKLTLPTKDTAIVPSILGGYFESLELDLFAKAAERSTTVLDIGANIGLFSCVAGKALQSGGAIYAFEPIAENAKYFRQNLLNNHLTNVELIESAVGQEVGELSIFVSRESIATHSASSRHSQGNESISVPMTSVDAFVASRGIGHVDVIKIDVEGYDGYVLKGAVETIKNYQPTIFIEYDPVCLKECGFEPADFADLLFTTYHYCLKLDEVSQTASWMTKQALLALPVYSNENLIFTNQGNLIESLNTGRGAV